MTESRRFIPTWPESALRMAALRNDREVSPAIMAETVCDGGWAMPPITCITPLVASTSALETGTVFNHAAVPLLEGKLGILTKGAGAPGNANNECDNTFGKASDMLADGT